MAARNRVHGRSRQGRYDEGHAEALHDDSWEERCPVRASRARQGEEDKARGGYSRPDHERQLRPVAGDEPAGPARHDEGDHYKRQKRAARRRSRVAVDLYQREGQEVEGPAQPCVQEQRQEVRPAEVARAEEGEGHHRFVAPVLDDYKGHEGEQPEC